METSIHPYEKPSRSRYIPHSFGGIKRDCFGTVVTVRINLGRATLVSENGLGLWPLRRACAYA